MTIRINTVLGGIGRNVPTYFRVCVTRCGVVTCVVQGNLGQIKSVVTSVNVLTSVSSVLHRHLENVAMKRYEDHALMLRYEVYA